MAASTTTNCTTMEIVIAPPRRARLPSGSLLELRVDEVVEREHLVPLLLGEELPLLHDDLVQALAGLVAFVGDLGTLLVAEGGLEHGHDAERVHHRVTGVRGIGGASLGTVH